MIDPTCINCRQCPGGCSVHSEARDGSTTAPALPLEVQWEATCRALEVAKAEAKLDRAALADEKRARLDAEDSADEAWKLTENAMERSKNAEAALVGERKAREVATEMADKTWSKELAEISDERDEWRHRALESEAEAVTLEQSLDDVVCKKHRGDLPLPKQTSMAGCTLCDAEGLDAAEARANALADALRAVLQCRGHLRWCSVWPMDPGVPHGTCNCGTATTELATRVLLAHPPTENMVSAKEARALARERISPTPRYDEPMPKEAKSSEIRRTCRAGPNMEPECGDLAGWERMSTKESEVTCTACLGLPPARTCAETAPHGAHMVGGDSGPGSSAKETPESELAGALAAARIVALRSALQAIVRSKEDDLGTFAEFAVDMASEALAEDQALVDASEHQPAPKILGAASSRAAEGGGAK